MPRGPSTDQHHRAGGGDRIARRLRPQHKDRAAEPRRVHFIGGLDRPGIGRRRHVLATGPSPSSVASLVPWPLVASRRLPGCPCSSPRPFGRPDTTSPGMPLITCNRRPRSSRWRSCPPCCSGRCLAAVVAIRVVAAACHGIASCLVVLAGNVRVIDAIGAATWNDAQASQLGPTRPGFASGHDLDELGAWGRCWRRCCWRLLWLRGLVSARSRGGGGAGQPGVPPLHRSGRRPGRPGDLGRSDTLASTRA